MPKIFMETQSAARHLGLSEKQFRSATERVTPPMEPLVFSGRMVDKYIWLREEIDRRADELRAHTGQTGRPKNQPAKLPGNKSNANESVDATE